MSPLIEQIWTDYFFDPMLNALLFLYAILFQNFALAIIVFTVIVRLLILPLTLRQLHSAKAMSTLQPRIQELNRKYGQDRERLSKETWALYREHGVNPAGCALPMFIQMPIWIGLYQAIVFAVGDRPENLLSLADHLYPWPLFDNIVPVSQTFLWMHLARPDPFYIIAILVGITAFIQQKMTVLPTTDANQAQMNRMMTWMMPIMYGYFTVVVGAGLALYWLVSNLIGIAIQYFVTGWGSLLPGQPGARGLAPLKEALSGLPVGLRGGARPTGSRPPRSSPPGPQLSGARPNGPRPSPVGPAGRKSRARKRKKDRDAKL